MRLAVMILALTSARAHAESPWVATVGLGATAGKLSSTAITPATDLGGGLQIDVGYRIHPTFALGAHVAATYVRLGSPNPSIAFVPMELGLVAHYVIADRFWIAPSLGIETDRLNNNADQYYMLDRQRTLALGLAVGADLARDGAHRVGGFAALAHSSYSPPPNEGGASQTFTALVVGVAYRYW